jgi:hypothetical protein
MMLRIFGAFGDRIGEDPAALVHLRELQEALTDQVNRGIWHANAQQDGYSQNHMAAMLGVSRQAIAKRIGLGEAVYTRMAAARGAGALVRIGDIRARRAQLLADAEVTDQTGSPRERSA